MGGIPLGENRLRGSSRKLTVDSSTISYQVLIVSFVGLVGQVGQVVHIR